MQYYHHRKEYKQSPGPHSSWLVESVVPLWYLEPSEGGSMTHQTASLPPPPPSTPNKHTTLHPLSLLHPRPTGNCRLSYCAFCKTWLNLINAVDFKQNHIWAEREREIERGKGRRLRQAELVRSLSRFRVQKYSTFLEGLLFLRRPSLECYYPRKPSSTYKVWYWYVVVGSGSSRLKLGH